MLSGIGNRRHLEGLGIPLLAELPVGDNLLNRGRVLVNSRIKDPKHFVSAAELSSESLSDLYLSGKGRLSRLHFNGLFFNTHTNKDPQWPNLLLFTSVNADQLQMHFYLARFRSRGQVRLRDKNSFLPPIIDSKYFSDQKDFEDAVEGMRFVFRVLEESPIAALVEPPDFGAIGCPTCPLKKRHECPQGIRCFIRYFTASGSHASGTCRMGAIERKDTVVDPLLRVKKVVGLRVCDSSVFPEVPNGNTHAPALMVGEKCAQAIKDWHQLQ